MAEDAKIQIHVWSDYVCPFCYLELPELERLASEMGDRLRIEWRAYELRPDPEPTLDPVGEYLDRVWNSSVYPMAAERGMDLKLPPVQPRSRKALEAAECARSQGRFDAMHRALFEAFFRDGRDIGDEAVLGEIASGVGLDPAKFSQALREGRFTAKVLQDQRLARELNISGVPGTLMVRGEQGLIISGAQPYEALKEAVEELLDA